MLTFIKSVNADLKTLFTFKKTVLILIELVKS